MIICNIKVTLISRLTSTNARSNFYCLFVHLWVQIAADLEHNEFKFRIPPSPLPHMDHLSEHYLNGISMTCWPADMTCQQLIQRVGHTHWPCEVPGIAELRINFKNVQFVPHSPKCLINFIKPDATNDTNSISPRWPFLLFISNNFNNINWKHLGVWQLLPIQYKPR